MRLNRWLLDKLSHTLEPELQHAVLGDSAELKVPERRAVFELLGLILRRQAPLWRTWRPWLALVGIVGPIGVLLSLISVGVVSEIEASSGLLAIRSALQQRVDQCSRDRNSGLRLVSGYWLVVGRRLRDGGTIRPSDLHQWHAILFGLVLSMGPVRNPILLGATPVKCLGSRAS